MEKGSLAISLLYNKRVIKGRYRVSIGETVQHAIVVVITMIVGVLDARARFLSEVVNNLLHSSLNFLKQSKEFASPFLILYNHIKRSARIPEISQLWSPLLLETRVSRHLQPKPRNLLHYLGNINTRPVGP